MILNLETEKIVDSSKRLGIVSGYSQLRTTLGILGLIGDLTLQLLHGTLLDRLVRQNSAIPRESRRDTHFLQNRTHIFFNAYCLTRQVPPGVKSSPSFYMTFIV